MADWSKLELVPPRLTDSNDRREMSKFISALMDNSKYTFEVSSTMPNWSDDQGTPIVYASGTTRRLCVYIGDQWNYFGFMDSDGKIIVDGEIEIGTTLKADGTNGLWLGHTTFASAPFRVSLAGALTATSATITGAITAESGTIGGFTIGASALTAGGGASAVGMAPANYPFYAGNTTPASAPFYVTNEGVIKAESGTIGGWTLAATTLSSTNITIDSSNELIKSNNFASGALGAGWQIDATTAEFNNIRARGKISTSVFEKDVISSVGGNLLVSDSDILNADMTALDASTLTIVGDTTFAVNDILRIKDGVDDEWLLVTNIGSAPTYTVTRDQAADYAADTNPIWKKGTAVVNFGASGEGLIFMTASEANSPHIDVVTHAGSPWDTLTTRMRIGNVNGFLGAASDLYGIYIGEATKYFKYDPTNGLQIRGIITCEAGTTIEGLDGTTVAGWSHASDATKIDGGDIYTGSVTATQITVSQLDAIQVNTGSLNVDESITVGSAAKVTIDGANQVIKVYDAASNLRVELGLLA